MSFVAAKTAERWADTHLEAISFQNISVKFVVQELIMNHYGKYINGGQQSSSKTNS